MTVTQEHLNAGLCIKCGHNRWYIHRRIRGWEHTRHAELSIDTAYSWFSIEDVHGDQWTDTDDVTEETATCERCEYELNIEDYDTPAVEAATHGRTL